MPWLHSVVVDTQDPESLSRFWSAALSVPVRDDFGEYVVLDSVPELCFQRVHDPTPGKNRLHLHLFAEGEPQAFIGRLLDLGATRRASLEMNGAAWVVLADPDGNEFCVGENVDLEQLRHVRSTGESPTGGA